MANVKTARERLRSAGLRVTAPRLAILDALAAHGRPASIEQIHRGLPGRRCDLVTVYRCMAALEEIGIVQRSHFDDGRARFALVADGGTARYHVLCKHTRQLAEIDADAAADLARAVRQVEDRLRARGYADVSHSVEFVGTAPAVAISASRSPAESADQARSAEGR